MSTKSKHAPLATYLNDHLGAANSAVELLEKWRDKSEDKDLRQFAARLVAEIKQDRAQLRMMIRAIGGGTGRSFKEVAGWLVEKATRFKLGSKGDAGLALFEGLEILSLGIAGKLGLWEMLAVVAQSDERLRRFNFRQLQKRAVTQRIRVERRRLTSGKAVFAPSVETVK